MPMFAKPLFPRRFFEKEYPKLMKLTDCRGNLPIISIVLPEGKRLDLREFEITDSGLLVNLSSGKYLIAYTSILSLQVMPQSLKGRFSEDLHHHSEGPSLESHS